MAGRVPRRVRRRIVAAVAVVTSCTCLAAVGLAAGVFDSFERRAVDRLFPGAPTDERIMLVAIDRETLQASGTPWPWPRDEQAALFEAIAAAEPALVVADLSYATATTPAADSRLAAAFASVPTVLAVPSAVERGDGSVPNARRVALPVHELASAAAGTGHVATYAHPHDGVVRSLPLVLEAEDGSLLPALSVAALALLLDADTQPIVRQGGVQVGPRLLPTERDGELRLNFAADVATRRRDGTIDSGLASVSAIDILEGRVAEDFLRDRVVLVGVADPSLGDRVQTPLARGDGVPGVVVHAQALNTMLTASYLRPEDRSTSVLRLAALAMLITAAVLWLPLWVAAVLVVVALRADLELAFARFDAGVVPLLVYPMLVVAFAWVGALGARYWIDARQQRRVELLFARYVPPAVARDLVRDGEVVQRSDGERVELTVLFCDIRGFTSLSERLGPQDLRRLLDEYYALLVDVIHEHGGTVLNFVGDEIFAAWGVPRADPHHRRRALEAALAMHEARTELTAMLDRLGLEHIDYGIGLSDGDAVAGHVGRGPRLQYTVLGETVNIGARLCSLAGAGDVVCTARILEAIEDSPPAQVLEGVTLKGVSRELQLVRLASAGR